MPAFPCAGGRILLAIIAHATNAAGAASHPIWATAPLVSARMLASRARPANAVRSVAADLAFATAVRSAYHRTATQRVVTLVRCTRAALALAALVKRRAALPLAVIIARWLAAVSIKRTLGLTATVLTDIEASSAA